MFNFLFDGTIGDILAPVVPSNKLYLAIQHHRNNEIDALWNATMNSANQLADDTQAPIHVACRYNNRYAVDYALSRGANIELPDRNGNTPLHYAAKYGNLDMCKYLVEKGAKAHLRNASSQTTYDVAENHLVRQYLLPIVLTCEREAAEASGVPIPGADYGLGIGGGSATPYTTYMSAPPPPPPMGGMYPPPMTNTSFPPPPPASTVTQPLNTPNKSLFQSIPLTPGQDIPGPSQVPIQPPIKNVENRSIVPDGFHSSASDPVLQQKYGHIIEVKNIAPPPTSASAMEGAPAAPTTYFSSNGTSYGPPAGNIYSRYVAFDATTNSAVSYNQSSAVYPTPDQQYGAPAAYSAGQKLVPQMIPSIPTISPYGSAPVTAPGFYPTATPNAIGPSNAAARLPVPFGTAPLPATLSSSGVSSSIGPTTPVHPTASRLTANKGELVVQSSNTLAVEVSIPTFVPSILQTTPKQKSTDSMHSIDLLTSPDGEIINAGASSSSVL